MKPLQELLNEAAQYHGHLCAGQVLGVRISMAALRWLGIEEPKTDKNLIVYVEIDRCAADAIHSVTGCKLGKRTLKHVDYGKMAATFVDLSTKRAIRVSVPESTRELARQVYPNLDNPYKLAYETMPDEQLLRMEEVIVEIPPEDLPGKPLRRVPCDICSEGINDGREVIYKGLTICRGCHSPNSYYKKIGVSKESVGELALKYHQRGMNGAQSVLNALMDSQVIPKVPSLVDMTAVWQGGVVGKTCSALAAGTLAIGTFEGDKSAELFEFYHWFEKSFAGLECTEITDQVGGRPSKTQKAFCDQICQQTANYIAQRKNLRATHA